MAYSLVKPAMGKGDVKPPPEPKRSMSESSGDLTAIFRRLIANTGPLAQYIIWVRATRAIMPIAIRWGRRR
jgi:hypothetical protein